MSDALDLLAALRLESGARWGEAAVPVQWADARAVLDEDSSTPYHWLSRSRGFSKTSDLGGMAVAAMLTQAPERARLYALAADQPQAALLLESVANFAHRTPEIAGALTIREWRVIAPRGQVVLEVLPSDSASIWGKRPWFAVCDELSAWHDTPRVQRVFEGLSTAMPKVPGSRMACLCTAGDPSHFSFAIRNAALEDPLWRVSEVQGPAPWIDPERLAGERRRLPESSYLRLFENAWTSGDDRLATDEDLLACIDADAAHEVPKPGARYVIAVDLGVKHDRSVAVICHGERVPGSETPRVVVDRMQVWTPSRLRPVRLKDVEEWLRVYARRYRATVVFDPSQALAMTQSLRRDGIPTREFVFSAGSVGKIATTLVQLVRERLLALPPDEALLDELRHVRLRESSVGVLRLDHDRSRHDDRVVALGIACSHLLAKGTPAPLRTASPFQSRPRPRREAPATATTARVSTPFTATDAWGFTAKQRRSAQETAA